MKVQYSKRCVVAYATAQQQYLWPVELPIEATIADALEQARQIANLDSVPWEAAPVGIYGEVRLRTAVPADGDRIEIYRALREDPRQRRRAAVQRQRRGP